MPRLPGRPLAGVARKFKGFWKIRVLDFSKLLPGPYATQVLADLGARVTRVELPYFGDMTRTIPPLIDGVGFAYWMVNQGKKALNFDFRKPEGMKRLMRLVKQADVLVEGFRPGLMDRIGLGYKALRKANPRLIYCSLTGYDPEGPWGRKAGHDLNFMAASGFLGLGNSEGRIAFPATPVADLVGSMGAVTGILAALLERRETGKGRHVIVPLTEAMRSWLVMPLGYLKATGSEPESGRHWWSGSHSFYRLYETKDGRQLAVAALELGFAVALLDALGLSELRDLPAKVEDRSTPALTSALEKTFLTATLAEWVERLKDKDVCVTPVYTLAEAATAG